jgi:hypothetical protein
MIYKVTILLILCILIIGLCSLDKAQYWSGSAILLTGSDSGTQLYFGDTMSRGYLRLKLPECIGTTVVTMNNLSYFIPSTDCEYYNSMYTFDASTLKTRRIDLRAPSIHALTTAATIRIDTIVYCGGNGGRYSSCYQYSVGDLSWNKVASMKSAIYRYKIVTLNNEVHVFGGQTNVGCECECNIASVYKYNDRWETIDISPMPVSTSGHSGIALDHDTALICGGNVKESDLCNITANCFTYTASTDTWHSVAPMAQARAGHSMVALNGLLQVLRYIK